MAEVDTSPEAVRARLRWLRSDDGSDYQRDQVTADLLEALSTKLAETERERDQLRTALAPFCRLGGPDDGVMPAYHDVPDDGVIYHDPEIPETKGRAPNITAGDIRQARNAYGILHAPWAVPEFPSEDVYAQRDSLRAELAEAQRDQATLDRILGVMGIADSDIDPVYHLEAVYASRDYALADSERKL